MKEEFIEDLKEKKKTNLVLDESKKKSIDEQAKEYNIYIKWNENKSNYFKSTYNIEDYMEEKVSRPLGLANINKY